MMSALRDVVPGDVFIISDENPCLAVEVNDKTYSALIGMTIVSSAFESTQHIPLPASCKARIVSCQRP